MLKSKKKQSILTKKTSENKLKTNKLLLTIMFGMLLLSLATISSLESLGTFKQNTEVRIAQVCSDATYINISSIAYPNGSVAVSNIEMTSSGSGEYYYEFTDTPLIGRYDVRGVSDGCENTFATYFEVTSNGVLQTTSQGIGSAVFLGLMLALTFLFGWIGFKLTESKNLWVLGVFFLFLSLLLVVYNVWLGYEYHRNFTGLSDSSMPETIFYIFMFLLVSGFLTSLGLLFLKWKNLARYIKNELRKKKEDEEFDKDFEE